MAHEITDRIHRYHYENDYLTNAQVFDPKTYDGGIYWHVAIKSGGVFHAAQCSSDDAFDHSGVRGWRLYEVFHGDIYTPHAPGTTVEDVEGATYARDTGTHWEFSHCSPGEHIDFAADVRLFARGQFHAATHKAMSKFAEASNRATRTRAMKTSAALQAFADAVGVDAENRVLAATLGHYHKDPHKDHKRQLTVAAITAVLADWKTKALTDATVRAQRAEVKATADTITARLSKTHTIQSRADKVAAAKAAAAKKAAAEDDE